MPTGSFPRHGQQPSTNHFSTHIIGGALVTASTPTVARGKGFTVTKPGTGRYLVTFNQNTGNIVSAVGTLRQAAGAANFLKGPKYTKTDNAVEFRVENASGTASDPGATDEIDFVIFTTMDKEPV